jgi:putative transposase
LRKLSYQAAPDQGVRSPYVESFNARIRDELFAREIFDSVLEAKVLYDDWRDHYNKYHPHSSLNWKSPEEFAEQINRNQPTVIMTN